MWFSISENKNGGASRQEMRYFMKMEINVGGKIVVIEAEGNISVKGVDVPVVCPPAPVPAPKVETVHTPQAIVRTTHPSEPVVSVPPPSSRNDSLFFKLVELRKQLAAEQGQPPYVIFHDKALREMCEKLPKSLEEFALIGGVGQSKLDRYGEVFISLIKEAA